MIDDNYIESYVYATYDPSIDINHLDGLTLYSRYQIKINSIDRNTLEDSSELASYIFITAREKLKREVSSKNMEITILYQSDSEYTIKFSELPEEIQHTSEVMELKSYLFNDLMISFHTH